MKFVCYAALYMMGLISLTEAQFDASKCEVPSDCPSTLCCGTAKPQDPRYGVTHKICYRKNKSVYMNYRGYRFDFQCNSEPKPEPKPSNDNQN